MKQMGRGAERSITWNLWGRSPLSIPCQDNTKKQNELWTGRVRCSADIQADAKPLPILALGQKWRWGKKKNKGKLVVQSCLTLCDPMNCTLPGSSVHGILQARILERVANSFSRGSSQPRD